jgi:ABC-2 type transport system permease protein
MTALNCAIAAEWYKLRTTRSTWVIVVGAVLLMMLGAGVAARDDVGVESADASDAALRFVPVVQFALGALGMLAMTSEYATRSIVVTLACTPSRTRLLLAKAVVVGVAVFVAGIPVTLLGVAVSAPQLTGLSHVDAGQLTARVLATAAYLALVAELALGLGVLIRRSAGALTVLFLLMIGLPVMLPRSTGRLVEFTPGRAGDHFMAGEFGYGLVVAGWASVAIAAGIWALRSRDA